MTREAPTCPALDVTTRHISTPHHLVQLYRCGAWETLSRWEYIRLSRVVLTRGTPEQPGEECDVLYVTHRVFCYRGRYGILLQSLHRGGWFNRLLF